MTYVWKNRALQISSLCFLLLGYVISYDIDQNYYHVYLGKLSQLPIRYAIIFIILYVDYLVFENINHPSVMIRHKNIFAYFLKSTGIEIMISLFLLLLMQIPILLLLSNKIYNIGIISLLFLVNALLVMGLIISMIRLLTIWIPNRLLATIIFLSGFILFDILLEHYNFFLFDTIIFDCSHMFILPFQYPQYIIIASILLISICFCLYISSIAIQRKDYMLKDYETNKR